MRRCLLVVLLAFACDEGATVDKAAPHSEPAPAPVMTPDAPPTVQDPRGAPVLELPRLTAGPVPPISLHGVDVWVGQHGIWVARSGEAPSKILELEQAKLPTDAAEILEPLAKALHALPGRPPPDPVVTVPLGPNPRTEPIVLRADAGTDAGTLRRVLTTARAVGFGSVSFVVNDGEDDKRTRGLLLQSLLPVAPASRRLETPVRLRLKADGSLSLQHNPMSHTEAAAELRRRAEFAEDVCVVLDADNATSYASWVETAGWVAEEGVRCLMLRSVAVPSDSPPPPPPPPMMEAEEEDDEDVADARAPEPVKPPAHPSVARAAYWWGEANAAAEVRAEARCKDRLASIRTMLAEADEGSESRSGLMAAVANAEDDCGDAKRANELRRLRTEEYPEDPATWLSLGIHELDPLLPEPGERYAEAIDPAERHARATRALAAFKKSAALAPKDDRGAHPWLSMAYMQRARARPGGGDIENPDLAARVDLMRAWEHTAVLCTLERRPTCPEPPSSPAAHAKDVAALAKQHRKK